MAAIPRRSFRVEASNDGEDGVRITSLVVTNSGRLVLADYKNMSVKATTAEHSARPLSLSLNVRPWDLAIFQEDVIAVTSGTDLIELLDLGVDAISVVRQIRTRRRYWCVTTEGQGDTLVVSSNMDHLGPAVVDVITSEGRVLWTLADDAALPGLRQPVSLCLLGRQVLVSDKNGLVHRVDVATGEQSPALAHPDLRWPGQVAADAAGNVYVASHQGACVLVHSPRGQWRHLLLGAQHGEGRRLNPQAVGVTETGIVVSWERDMSDSAVVGFDL